jgi:hypothetical protein
MNFVDPVDLLVKSGEFLVELMDEQYQALFSGDIFKVDNHRLSEAGLLLGKVMKLFPPATTIPCTPHLEVEKSDFEMRPESS